MTDLKPKQAIRRFDIFAEYQRLKGLNEKMAPDEAKGYGIWLAKVVAARKFNRSAKSSDKPAGSKQSDERETLVENKWRTLDGTPQTDDLFDKEIVRRMGDDFYNRVFAPAVEHAFKTGEDYTEIRDKLRKEWKP